MMVLGQFHFGMLNWRSINESHFVRRSSTVHSLKMKYAQHCIQKLRHPKLLKILATHVLILGICILPQFHLQDSS